MRSAVKKFYKFANGGHDHPDKVDLFTVKNGRRKASSVTLEGLSPPMN
ncbi:hypothetical protein [Halorarum salinum]|uniref:Uncharacterized protein n=1 Tax=Halorarum salinum TaxID=2743089 RepID=A0A7D5LA27_9EURY|nr:hypothetical protein [Halobaculum salinum]QLG61886.1 hypothetical protein HUG12_09205 [Halobaculum salinum]